MSDTPKTTIPFSSYGGMEIFGVVFSIRKMQFLSPVFPVFTPFFHSKTLANRLILHENRVKISFGCQHCLLTMPIRAV